MMVQSTSALPAPLAEWHGFEDPNYTPVPDSFFDILLPILTDVEVRVLLYIIRRTYGFKKPADSISLSQIVSGIVTRDGRRLDSGAGVKKDGAIAAIRRLEARGILLVQRNQSAERGFEATTYRLRKAREPWSAPPTSLVGPADKPSRPARDPLVGPADRQETAVQDTVRQEEGVPSSQSENPREVPPRHSPYIAGVVLDHAADLGASSQAAHDLPQVLAAWQASGQTEDAFVARLHAARAAVRQQQRPGMDKWRCYLAAILPAG